MNTSHTLFRRRAAYGVATAWFLILGGTVSGNQYSLTDPGFNSGSQALLPAGTFTFDRWEVESAALIVGPQAGVTPFEGNGMLRLNATGGVVTHVWQFLDLTPLAAQINAGNVTVDAYAFFNSRPGHTPRAALRISGRSGLAPNFFLRPVTTNSTTSLVLDGVAATWERLNSTVLTLPAGTNLLEFELAYVESTLPPANFAFADLAYVCFNIVPEPASLGMTVIGVALLGLAHRQNAKNKNI
ncbi:MAG TPA: hypothetical protein VIY86_01115 [Pirellulaceae bacterium]